MPYILRAKNTQLPFDLEVIVAWNVVPDLELAPVEAWEEVTTGELADVLADAPSPSQDGN